MRDAGYEFAGKAGKSEVTGVGFRCQVSGLRVARCQILDTGWQLGSPRGLRSRGWRRWIATTSHRYNRWSSSGTKSLSFHTSPSWHFSITKVDPESEIWPIAVPDPGSASFDGRIGWRGLRVASCGIRVCAIRGWGDIRSESF